MDNYIKGVTYRHVLLTAYLKVIGRTKTEAEQQAKKVGTALHERLPEVAVIGVPRYRGFDPKTTIETFEIPIVIAGCERRAKAELARLVLRGAA